MTIKHQERITIKKKAKSVVKGHYWLLLLVCMFAAILGVDFKEALSSLKFTKEFIVQEEAYKKGEVVEEQDDEIKTNFGFDEILDAINTNNVKKWEENTEKKMADASNEEEKSFGALKIGQSRGALAMVVNRFKSGNFYAIIVVALQTIFDSEQAGAIIFVFLALLIIAFVQVVVINPYQVIMARIFLEARTYESVPMQRFLFLIYVKKMLRVAWVLLVQTIYAALWSLTIIGGVIKKYSYMMVPYIMAENPTLKANEAITLSRKMMQGHKWEAFKLGLSFLLWSILNSFTLGLVGVFWFHAYKAATYAEFYALLREDYKANDGENHEVLCDTYLYEHADPELINEMYQDVLEWKKEERFVFKQKNPILRFLQNTFGIVIGYDENEIKRREQEVKDANIHMFEAILAEKMYPSRLSIVKEKEKIKSLGALRFLRCYSVTSLILIAFFFSILGYVWEVSIHLITDGDFVNRGVLHGPWLPIYGAGGILITLLLYRFRKKPWLEFISAVIVAGTVEYISLWYLEIAHDGAKWWDYSNYFLNINGRVCAEGLLVFGLGGIAIVYLVAPILDDQFVKIPRKISIILCTVLIVLFLGDGIYSDKHPNSGKGITDYESRREIPSQLQQDLLISQSIGELFVMADD